LQAIAGVSTVRAAGEGAGHPPRKAILDLIGAWADPSVTVGSVRLPYGTLKLLELGCALATDPDVLLLDEPSSGHGPRGGPTSFGEAGCSASAKRSAVTMLLIEPPRAADHGGPATTSTCSNFGKLLSRGRTRTIVRNPPGGRCGRTWAARRRKPSRKTQTPDDETPGRRAARWRLTSRWCRKSAGRRRSPAKEEGGLMTRACSRWRTLRDRLYGSVAPFLQGGVVLGGPRRDRRDVSALNRRRQVDGPSNTVVGLLKTWGRARSASTGR